MGGGLYLGIPRLHIYFVEFPVLRRDAPDGQVEEVARREQDVWIRRLCKSCIRGLWTAWLGVSSDLEG